MFTIRRSALIVFMVGLAIAAPLRAAQERLQRADVRAIEQVIRDQLDAFGHDDAERAWGHSTPEIQKRFGSPDDFMRMVRENYQAVYRAGRIQFVRLRKVDGIWSQTVDLVDEAGSVWRATYLMKRQGKGWKIGGCTLTETSIIAT
jgi:hypothetical protein